jgi:flagellar FliL protein
MIPALKCFLMIAALTLAFAQTGLAQEETSTEEQTQEEEEAEPGVTDYISMNPPFVTHVGKPGPSLIYLKAAVTLRASNTNTRVAVEAHMPRLRHEIVMLFGEQTNVDELSGNAGQNALREEAKNRINQALAEQQTGESVSDVLFTEFVLQR